MHSCPHLQPCCSALWGTWKDQLITLCRASFASSASTSQDWEFGGLFVQDLFSVKYVSIQWRLDTVLSFANAHLTVSCSHLSSCFFSLQMCEICSYTAFGEEKSIPSPSYPSLRSFKIVPKSRRQETFQIHSSSVSYWLVPLSLLPAGYLGT